MRTFFFSITLIALVTSFFAIWNLIDDGYDKQNKVVVALKKIIPSSISRKVRDTIKWCST